MIVRSAAWFKHRIPRLLVLLFAASCTGGTNEVALETTLPVSTVLFVASTPTTPSSTTAPTTTTTAEPTTTAAPTTEPPPPPRSDELVMEQIDRLTADLASKSVVASGTGYFFAQNMMYRHTITVFDGNEQLVATIPDTVDLAAFGFDVPSGDYQGAPVEAAFSPDGRYGYVSNYQMYGPGFGSGAGDNCNRGEGQNSYVYRIDTELLGASGSPIDAVYEVGSVPKYLQVTPDNRFLLVTNWCSFDMSVIDLESGELVRSIPLGRHPRGIAVSSDSKTAYATVMGGSDIAVIDLERVGDGENEGENGGEELELSWLKGVGANPRHLVISPDNQTLYVTLNGEGTVIKVDLHTGEVVDRVRTGSAPRSMAIADDGHTIYVVNYESDTMSQVRTSDFEILQTFKTAHHPIGITYDGASREVWVSAYSGVIHVYAQTELNLD